MNPEIAQYEALYKEGLRRCMAEEEPTDLHAWTLAQLTRIGGGSEDAVLGWVESFDLYDALLAQRATLAEMPEAERRMLDWPWGSWNRRVRPPKPGILVAITAPDGQGKTIVAESIAEHWARRHNRVVFLHYELNREFMLDRRTARHTNLTLDQLESGKLTVMQRELVAEARERLIAWDGFITYVHTPGWDVDRTTSELRKLYADERCDAVVLDYLEKIGASSRQIKLYGSQAFQREADNVEQIKNFAESAQIPVVMIAQMSKYGKGQSADKMDRSDMRGAGEKSEKSNVVILMHRDRTEDGYSNIVDVVVDKNTTGPTGSFKQVMRPEFYSIADIANRPSA